MFTLKLSLLFCIYIFLLFFQGNKKILNLYNRKYMYSYQKVINLSEVNFISFYHFIVHLIVFYSNRFEFVKEDFVIIRRENSVTEKCR